MHKELEEFIKKYPTGLLLEVYNIDRKHLAEYFLDKYGLTVIWKKDVK